MITERKEIKWKKPNDIREREREKERESVCVCVRVSVCVGERERGVLGKKPFRKITWETKKRNTWMKGNQRKEERKKVGN